LKEVLNIGGSEYWGGLEGRSEGGAIGTGALSLVRGFSGPPSSCLFCGLQRLPVFEYLDSNMELFLVVLEIKEKMYIGDLSPLFLSFTKSLIVV
jgi:hypothetical protein